MVKEDHAGERMSPYNRTSPIALAIKEFTSKRHGESHARAVSGLCYSLSEAVTR